ncbi:MAG: hypothetical protein KTR25_17675 [Myxococcales bacterium]|nr:hypothetical protein [Myxococcales bacterium]
MIREVSFPWNAPGEEGAYRAYATDGRAMRLTHFSDGLLEVSPRSRTAGYARLVVIRAFHEKSGSTATHMAKSTGCLARGCEGSAPDRGYWVEGPERETNTDPHNMGYKSERSPEGKGTP